VSDATRPLLQPGAIGRAALRIETADLAKSLALEPGDDFPPVLATARMIALMEIAAARVLRPLLGEGEVSVGVTVDIKHSAATLAGETAVAEACFTGLEGKLYTFEVVAHDSGGEIGRGLHSRAIIHSERLLAGAQKRSQAF
jgi:fluoroacetyl-CoA thioesterase